MTESQLPTTDTALVLNGPAGTLQAMIEWPDAGHVRDIAIVCHPLPTEGGTMDNKVVTMTARALREAGIATLRFNFRGTGNSAGVFDQGLGEQDDLLAVAAWLRAQRPDARLWLAGFSFGSYVSLACAAELAPHALISIAPPAGRWAFHTLAAPQMPWLLVMGDADEIVDPQAVRDWVATLDAPQLQCEWLPGASHFFHGRLVELRKLVHAFALAHVGA